MILDYRSVGSATTSATATITTIAGLPTGTSSVSNPDASRVAHVTSAVIGCILGGALAGAIFALGLALYRFRRRQTLRKRLMERITTQIDLEHANAEPPLSSERRKILIQERFHIVAERYWRAQRRAYARNGRRPNRRRDDLRDMTGDFRFWSQGRVGDEPRRPEAAYSAFGGSGFLQIYSNAGSRDRLTGDDQPVASSSTTR